MQSNNEDSLVGKRVRIKKNQGLIVGIDKYPGRYGTVIKQHPFKEPEPLFYIELEPTSRAKSRVETFWLRNFFIVDEE